MSKTLALCCMLALYAASAAAASAQIPRELGELLDEHRVPESHVGLHVVAVEDGETAFSLNAEAPFNPASVIKLLPSLAALEMFSPAYQWSTGVYTAKTPVDGVLDGDLYIKGGGDPYLTVESLWALLKSVRALGIERIAGDIVVDNSVFKLPHFDRGTFDGRPYRIYNGPPDGLMLNFWAVRFTISALAGSVHVDAFPDSRQLNIVNRVKHSDGPCNRGNRFIDYRIADATDSVTVTFDGVLSRRCPPVIITRAVIPVERYAAYVLPGLWRDAGGVLDGVVRQGAVPGNAGMIYSHPSPTMAEVVRAANKFSNNMMARHLLIALGSLYKDKGIEVDDGVNALQEWLLSKGIDVPGLNIVNGSGLSRDARISALGMANVLRAGFQSRYAPEFLASFPVAGEDSGPALREFSGGNGAMVRLKTGLIDHVRTMAAYVTAGSGKTYIVVLLVNHPGAHRGLGTQLQNAVIRHVLGL